MSIRSTRKEAFTDGYTTESFLRSPVLVAIAAIALAGAGIAMLASPAAAAHGGQHVAEGESIQAAIDAADPGETIVVEGTSYTETLTIDTNEAGEPLDGLTLEAADGTNVTVDGSSGATVVDVQASDVTLDGLTFVWDAEITESIRVVDVGGEGALLTDVTIELPGGFCDPQTGSCPAPQGTAVWAGAGTTIEASAFETDYVDVQNATAAGTHGVNANTNSDVVIRDTTISGFGMGVVTWGENTRIENAGFDTNVRGVQISTDAVEIHDTDFTGHRSAIYVAGGSSFSPSEVTVRDSQLGLTNQNAIAFEGDKEDAFLDAEFNHWGVVKEEFIQNTRIDWTTDTEAGRVNDVDLKPYLDASGQQVPPQPTVECTNAKGNATSVEADTPTLQSAIDLALPDECVDADEDGSVERTIILQESYEEYDGATIDTPVTLESENLEAVRDVSSGQFDFGARVQAFSGQPALHFVEGSQNSQVRGLGLQAEPVGTNVILAEDIDGDSGITVEDVGIGSRTDDGTQNVVVRDVTGFTLSSSTLVSGDPVVLLENTEDTTIDDNRLIYQPPGPSSDLLTDATGIAVDDGVSPTIVNNTFVGNNADETVGVDVTGTQEPAVVDNVFAKLDDGVAIEASSQARVEQNTFAFPSIDLDLDHTGIQLVDGADHTVERNTIQFADTGLAIDGAEGVEGDLNRYNATTTGIRVDNLEVAEDPDDELAFTNATLAATLNPLDFTGDTDKLDVDAECDDWGVYTNDTVESRANANNGGDNDVDAQPFTSPNTDEDKDTIDCIDPPEAEYDWTVPEEPVTRLDDVQFVDQSEEGTYSIQERAWDFDDGNTSTGESPTHQFEDVGSYFVELTVSDTVNMTSSRVQEVVVENLEPEVTTFPTDTEIEHNDEVSFTFEAQDPEDDDLTFDLKQADGSPLPVNSSFEQTGNNTAVFDWNPEPDQYGTYDLQLSIDDGYDVVTRTVTLDVTNDKPTFDPELPAILGGAVNRTMELEVNPYDPDVGDEISAFEANLSELPVDDTSTVWTYDAENKTGTLSWTPQDGDDGEYNITFSAESPAREVTKNIDVVVRADNLAPSLTVNVKDFVEGQNATVYLEADDPENDEINWTVQTPEVIDDTDLRNETPDFSEATWEWAVPRDAVGTYEVTFVADDGWGEISKTTTIDVDAKPWADTKLPMETETGKYTTEPMNTSEVLIAFSAVHLEEDLTPQDMQLRLTGEDLDTNLSVMHSSESDAFPTEHEDLYGATYTFTETGTYSAEVNVTDSDGNTDIATVDFIQVQPNSAPTVSVEDELVWTNSTDPAGAEVTLSASAEDPEGRMLSSEAFEWKIPGQTNVFGEEVSPTLSVGTHPITLEVTDPFGESTQQTVVVNVDDTIDLDAELDAPQTDEGHYMVDPLQHSFEELSGTATVTNDLDAGVDGGVVSGTVYYHGAETNDAGIAVATFTVTTDSNGEAQFSYQQEVVGAQPTAFTASWLSAPGWHEIELTSSAPSRAAAPDATSEVRNATIEYMVAPAGEGETGAQASAACYDAPASEDNRSGAEDGARATVTPSGDANTATPGADNVTAGAGAFAGQGADCKRGYGQASLFVFDFVAQACYDSEVSVHAGSQPCPAPGDGIPLSPSVGSGASEAASWGVEGEGACYYDGEGGQDDSHVRYELGEDPDTETPGAEPVQAAITACAQGLTNGTLPEGGSFLAVTGTAAGEAIVVEVDTVPATNAATGESDPGATGAEAEGACYHDGEGAQDSAGAFLGPAEPQAEGPDVGAVMAGLSACANAGASGQYPDGGSKATFTATALGSTAVVTVDTVPVSAALTP